jgi:mRNA interferase MazF
MDWLIGAPTAEKKLSMTKAPYAPDSGDIIWLDLNPRTGHEQSGRRPCLVLSSRLYSELTGMAVICPTTSKVKGLPFEIPLSETKTQGVILPIHVRSIDLDARYPKLIEKSPPKILEKTRDYVRVIIGAVEE